VLPTVTGWQQVAVMEFRKPYDTTDTTGFCQRQLVADLLRENGCNGFWSLDDGDFYRGVSEAGENGSAQYIRKRRTTGVTTNIDNFTSWKFLKFSPQFITASSFFPFLRRLRILPFYYRWRSTQQLCLKVFEKIQELAAQFAPLCTMADIEELGFDVRVSASLLAVPECWGCRPSLSSPAISVDPFICLYYTSFPVSSP